MYRANQLFLDTNNITGMIDSNRPTSLCGLEGDQSFAQFQLWCMAISRMGLKINIFKVGYSFGKEVGHQTKEYSVKPASDYKLIRRFRLSRRCRSSCRDFRLATGTLRLADYLRRARSD